MSIVSRSLRSVEYLISTVVMGIILSVLSHAAFADSIIPPQSELDTVTVEFTSSLRELDDRELARRLKVYVGTKDGCCSGRTAVAGSYRRDRQELHFSPRFDFLRDQSYVIQWQGQQGTLLREFVLDLEQPAKRAEVTHIYPSSESIPENTLRFYLHFSQPMKPHVAADYIALLDERGVEDKAALMKFKQELWSADRKRLTVLIDPGRIKRLVATNLDLGPVLEQGKRYTLTVKSGWPTANGGRTLAAFSKTYRVSGPLRTLPDIDHWEITAPPLMSRAPLTIKLDRLYDHHLLHSHIQVQSPDGNRIAGSIHVDDTQRVWQFIPASTWRSPRIHLEVDPRLEDVAANNFKDLLDHELNEPVNKSARLTFSVQLQQSETAPIYPLSDDRETAHPGTLN